MRCPNCSVENAWSDGHCRSCGIGLAGRRRAIVLGLFVAGVVLIAVLVLAT